MKVHYIRGVEAATRPRQGRPAAAKGSEGDAVIPPKPKAKQRSPRPRAEKGEDYAGVTSNKKICFY